jgi:heterotetrameric sarcosine oxidase gamma subunit
MAEVKAPERRSPLAHREAIQGRDGLVRLGELAFLEKFVLRAERGEAAERLRELGLGLPFDPLTSSTADGVSLLWMGPDEWMLVTPPEAAQRASGVGAALAGTHHQLVDVSDYYTAIEVAGPKARELLMKLTTLDLHPRSFRSGMTTGAIFGRANAVLWLPLDQPEAFRLFIRWSMADYLWCLLANAGREWGVPVQVPEKGERLTVD